MIDTDYSFSEEENKFIICDYYIYYNISDNNLKYCTSEYSCPKDFNKIIEDKNQCINDCSQDNYYKYEFRHSCYEECPPIISEISSTKDYYCEAICNKEYPYEIIETQECVNICTEREIQNGICKINYKLNPSEIDNNYYDTFLNNIEDIYTSKNYDTSYLDNGNDDIIKMEKITVFFTTSKNQKQNIYSDTANIDIGECENSLKQFYNLSDDSVLYIKMLEISQEKMRIPKMEYDIYAKLNGENLTKLDLNPCKNNKISLSIPVDQVENLDKLNSTSPYYNDFCHTATSDKGTDITLKDRKSEYPSIAVCQDDCTFVDYNYTLKKAKCSCDAKESSSSFAEMKIDKKKLLDNFKNIKNIANFNILKCFHVLFCKKGISRNIGFYILISIILFHTITLFEFYLKGLNALMNKIKEIIFAIINLRLKKELKGEEIKNEIIEIESKEKKME